MSGQAETCGVTTVPRVHSASWNANRTGGQLRCLKTITGTDTWMWRVSSKRFEPQPGRSSPKPGCPSLARRRGQSRTRHQRTPAASLRRGLRAAGHREGARGAGRRNPYTPYHYPPVIVAHWEKQDGRYFLEEIPHRAAGTNGLGVGIDGGAPAGWEIVKEHTKRDALAFSKGGRYSRPHSTGRHTMMLSILNRNRCACCSITVPTSIRVIWPSGRRLPGDHAETRD